MRVLHFSDIHLDVPLWDVPLRDWLGKRVIGGANLWASRSKHFKRSKEKLDALAGFVREQQIDLVVCTGDYTTLGTETELRAARAAVDPLTKTRFGYVTVPGNHDLYVGDSIRENRFERYFGDLLSSDLAVLDPSTSSSGPVTWPIVRLVGEHVAVIAVNSARPNPQPWRSSGYISEAQLETLERLVADPRIAKRFIFVITHYAPRRRDGTPDTRLHGLKNADAFLALCARIERGAILHGHVHWCYQTKLPWVNPVIFGAGSATHDRREGIWTFEVDADSFEARAGYFDGQRYVLGDRPASGS